ncbi:MAG: hypothetical protein R6T78_02195 [Dehalococcoidales bacterium]
MIFNRKNRNCTKKLIFLLPVRIDDEILPEEMVRMLCCTETAEAVTTTISRSTFEIIKSYTRELERGNKRYAILGIELPRGCYVPFPVYIDSEHLMVLENIVEHAIHRKFIPYILRKYVKHIIALGNISSKEIIKNYVLHDQLSSGLSSQSMINDIRASRGNMFAERAIPTYKAHNRYPAIILKKMDSIDHNDKETQRVLILDSDGDLAISKVPAQLLLSEERKFNLISEDLYGCVTYKQEGDRYFFDHMILNKLQHKSLNTILEQYEKTGTGERPIPLFAQEVISRARVIFKEGVH